MSVRHRVMNGDCDSKCIMLLNWVHYIAEDLNVLNPVIPDYSINQSTTSTQ